MTPVPNKRFVETMKRDVLSSSKGYTTVLSLSFKGTAGEHHIVCSDGYSFLKPLEDRQY